MLCSCFVSRQHVCSCGDWRLQKRHRRSHLSFCVSDATSTVWEVPPRMSSRKCVNVLCSGLTLKLWVYFVQHSTCLCHDKGLAACGMCRNALKTPRWPTSSARPPPGRNIPVLTIRPGPDRTWILPTVRALLPRCVCGAQCTSVPPASDLLDALLCTAKTARMCSCQFDPLVRDCLASYRE